MANQNFYSNIGAYWIVLVTASLAVGCESGSSSVLPTAAHAAKSTAEGLGWAGRLGLSTSQKSHFKIPLKSGVKPRHLDLHDSE